MTRYIGDTKNYIYKTTLNAKTVGTVTTDLLLPGNHLVESVKVYTDGLGASVILDVGVVGSNSLFLNDADVAAAGMDAMTDTLAGGVFTKLDLPVYLTFTTAGATTTSSDKVLWIQVKLVQDTSRP